MVLWAHSCCATLSNYVSQTVSKLVTKTVFVFLNLTRHPVHTVQDFSASQAKTCLDLSRLKQKHCGCTITCPVCPRNLHSSKAVTSSLSLRFLLYQWWFGVFILKRNCSAQKMCDLVNFTFPEVLQYCQELVQDITPQNQAGAGLSRAERSRAPQPSLLAGEARKGEFSTKWGSTAYGSSLLLE